MSFNLTINFESYEDIQLFINDMNKFKQWKTKQDNKKKSKDINEEVKDVIESLKTDTPDKRGLHQQHYHNEAKLYHNQHKELSYRECLKIVYSNKNNNNI